MKKKIVFSCFPIAIFLMAIAFILPLSIQGKGLKFSMEDSLTINNDTLPYPIEDFNFNQSQNFNTNIIYDLNSQNYTIYNQIGNINLTHPMFMTKEEYREYIMNKQIQEYWEQKTQTGIDVGAEKGGLLPQIQIGSEAFEKIFGGNTVSINPTGSAELTFSLLVNKVDNPTLPVQNRKSASFNFDQKIQMSVTGSIGDKLHLQTNYDTEATFDFENEMKLEFIGDEDDIIKRIELGNVSLPISGTLITGAQSLFGIKGQFQFGRATLTTVYSEQKSESEVINVEGGATTNDFELNADDYEDNKHFFLGQYFHNNYDVALSNLPIVSSGININRIEVWITNKTGETENIRNIIGMMDLGEQQINNNVIVPGTYGGPYPSNTSNSLDPPVFFNAFPDVRDINQVNSIMSSWGFNEGKDYVELENARLLSESEYTLNTQLGYISLNQTMYSDEVLAVAFQYTINGQTYQVGEFSNDGVDAPDVLMVKLLKSNITHVDLPIWDLMMKNVYSIGGYQINKEDFVLNVLYSNDQSGVPINFIPEGAISQEILLRVLNLDNLNSNSDPSADGVFDFIEGITINSSNGRVIFPVVEPFGEYLRNQFIDQTIADKYVYDPLYDSTKFAAQQFPELNKFIIQGEYKGSSGSVIPLNAMNVPQGSVTVTAGGAQLEENIHYIVDYTLGSVTILDEGLIASGTPIQISLESNSMFNIQTKRFMGAHLDYQINDNFNIESSILSLRERPLTEKVTIGEEPISNTIWGLMATYNIESRFLTNLIDKIPLIETKAPSTITVVGEFAQLIPGSPKVIHLDEGGTSYIDDFETSQTSNDIKNVNSWKLSSTPQDDFLFPEASLSNDITYGFNRSKIAWYTIDPLFHRNNSITPDHIANDPDMQSNHYAREVLITEIFPNTSIPNGQPTTLAMFDLAYYPNERGPYNFDVEPTTYSSGLNVNGFLNNPETRWGGVMRKLETNDFETANIEFIEFWMMDPFMYNPAHEGGDLYFNLGNISEDILKDSRKSFENGLPINDVVESVDTTAWGRVPTTQAIVLAFDNADGAREYQDVGLDGMTDEDEVNFHPNGDTSYPTYLQRVETEFSNGSSAYQNALQDPAADNYHYFRGSDYDSQELGITERYKLFNGLDGNSPTAEDSPETYPTSASSTPDAEDINNDQTLSKTESYYQYKVSLRPQDLRVGNNYITDSITVPVTLENNNVENATWYQFKIPIFNPEKVVGGINDFRSIRFMRMFLKNFEEECILRFATLDLVRGDWRRYEYSLKEPNESLEDDTESNTVFDLSAVNIEENGNRTPINYVLPPGIDREIMFGTTDLQEQNEQSLSMKVCNLQDGDARAAFKNLDIDMRTYKRLKMFVHAEAVEDELLFKDGDVNAFIRMGSDNTNNYYQYEIPLTVTDWGETDESLIWPEENQFDIEFALLQTAKQIRNDAIRNSEDVTYQTHFVYEIPEFPGHKITIVGSPNIGNIKTLMIGVKNPKDLDPIDMIDDGLSKCFELWINELRLAEFDERGGWAANARVVTQLADFGTVTVAGSMSSIGFGSLEKNVLERNQEFTKQYDVSSNFELGKFFPEKSKIKIPFYYSLSEELSNPQFNPLDPDIELTAALDAMPTQAERDSIKYASQDYVKRKSINFTNVRKEQAQQSGGKGKKKQRVYDIENFSLSYSFNETFTRDINTEYNTTKSYVGSLNYSFNKNPKSYKPFSKVKLFKKSNYFRILRDFNVYLTPSRITFRTDINRSYNETLLRNTGDAFLLIEPTFNKSFTLDRIFDIKYDLSRSLKLDFSATSNSWVDEPEGRLDTEEKMDTLWQNFLNLGRPINYHQTLNVNYTLPINKLPITDWITSTVRYTSNYDWIGASLSAVSLGHTIQNSRNIQFTGQMNMNTLYNKVGFFKKLNAQSRQPMKTGGRGNNKSQQKQQQNQQQQNKENKNRDEEEEIPDALKYLGNFIMAIKNISITYSSNEGMVLPGFMPENTILGFNPGYGSGIAPTPGFLFGSQRDIRPVSIQKNWITNDTLLYSQFSKTLSNTFSFRSTVEPVQGFRLNITASRNYSSNLSEYFKDTTGLGEIVSLSPINSGSFSMSFFSLRTMFERYNDDYDSEAFNQFLNNRNVVATNYAIEHFGATGVTYNDTVDDNFPDGYGKTSQEVLITSFLAAYSGKNAANYSLNKFPKIPAPNWDLTYDGLMKLKWFKDRFRSVTFAHAYRSTYSMSSFTSNLLFVDYDEDGYDDNQTLDVSGNIIPGSLITSISISEQFSPLIRIDMTLKNSLNARVEIKKDRNLTFNFSNNQLTEVKGSEVIIGTGYTIKDVEFVFKSGGRKRNIKSDLDLRLDFSISNNVTVIRDLESPALPTAGSRLFSLKFTADYKISSNFNISLFYDRTLSSYVQSTSYPTANTNAGISTRFSIQ